MRFWVFIQGNTMMTRMTGWNDDAHHHHLHRLYWRWFSWCFGFFWLDTFQLWGNTCSGMVFFRLAYLFWSHSKNVVFHDDEANAGRVEVKRQSTKYETLRCDVERCLSYSDVACANSKKFFGGTVHHIFFLENIPTSFGFSGNLL